MDAWIETLSRLLRDGKTNEEICVVLGINEHAMWKRVARAGFRIETDTTVRRLIPREQVGTAGAAR